MRIGLVCSLLAALVALVAGSIKAPAPPKPTKAAGVVGTGGAVASVDPDATRAGIRILREGGNAVDAAVAANAVLGVTEPFVAGIGGGGFMVVYLAHEHRVVTIDGRETSPQNFPQDAFIDPQTGQPIPFTPQRVTSGMAVGVPGTLATWATAERRFGTMSLASLLRPAIGIALRGFTVDQTFHDQTQQNLARLGAFTSSRSLFLTPDGQPPAVGSVLRNPQLANTYRNRWVGDPDFSSVPLDGLLSEGFASERRCLIGPTAATSPVAPGDPTPPFSSSCEAEPQASAQAGREGTSTNHLTVVDRDGNVVAYTSTIEQIAGSGMAVPC